MLVVKGHVVQGCKHFQPRMTKFRNVFREAVGEELFPGTLNVKVDGEVLKRVRLTHHVNR